MVTPREFSAAASQWDLERLYNDLAKAKREYAPHTRRGLTSAEKLHLQGLLCSNSPTDIARVLHKSEGGVKTDLSKTLYRYVEALTQRAYNSLNNWRDVLEWLEEAGYKETRSPFPLPPDPFGLYVERPPVEMDCEAALAKPGALLRIKAPQQMGKSWLCERTLRQAQQVHGCQTATLSFDLADGRVFSNLETFSQWFCVAAGQQLGLSNQLDNYWDDILACNYNTTLYFQDYLLANLEENRPLALALDNVDLVFEHPAIAIDFCKLLRNWHDRARRMERNSTLWQKLRLAIVHATEVYSALDINSSPLAGVGVVVDIPEFTIAQVEQLAHQYQLSWNSQKTQKLMDLVGGHPYLVQKALDAVRRGKMNLDRLLADAPTEAGIYRNHLHKYLEKLQQSPELLQAFNEVLRSPEPIEVKSVLGFKLQSMGLVALDGDRVRPRCSLYVRYFRDRL